MLQINRYTLGLHKHNFINQAKKKKDRRCTAALQSTTTVLMKDVFSHSLPWLVGSPSSQGYAPLVVYSSLAHWNLAVADDADPAAKNPSLSAAPL
jgi:hypothetical protein